MSPKKCAAPIHRRAFGSLIPEEWAGKHHIRGTKKFHREFIPFPNTSYAAAEREWNATSAQWTRRESSTLVVPRWANEERLKRAPVTAAESLQERYLPQAHERIQTITVPLGYFKLKETFP